MSAWLQTHSGRVFDLEFLHEPMKQEIHWPDIAYALSNIRRFGGHGSRGWTVAHHCLLVMHLVAPTIKLHALLHDAQEAYVGDMPTPLKRLLRQNVPSYYDEIEEAISRRIHIAAGAFFPDTPCPAENPTGNLFDSLYAPAVKAADLQALADERAAFHLPPPRSWGEVERITPNPIPPQILALTPEQAESAWLTALYTYAPCTRPGAISCASTKTQPKA